MKNVKVLDNKYLGQSSEYYKFLNLETSRDSKYRQNLFSIGDDKFRSMFPNYRKKYVKGDTTHFLAKIEGIHEK